MASEEADEGEAALLEGAAREEGVAGAAQAVGPGLVALLQGAQGFLVQGADGMEGAAAGGIGGAPQGGIDGGQGVFDPLHLALHRLAGASEGRLDLGVGLSGPPGHHGLGVALQVGELQALGLEGARLGRLHEGDAGPRQQHRPGHPEVGVGRDDLRVIGDLRGSRHVGGGGQERVLHHRAEERARAPVGGIRLEKRAPRRPRS